MDTIYKPINTDFHNEIKALATNKKYIGIQYFTAIHELISTTAIIKAIFTKDKAEYILLNTGEEIRLDQIVRINEKPAPGYNIEDFTCDC